jgi:hypothetical protein
MTNSWDYHWQRFFALSGILGVFLCLLSWEVFWPQPPDFSMTGAQTAQFYATHQMGMLIGITLSSIGMPFLASWDLQLGMMMKKLEGGSGLVSIVATVGITSISVLLTFDCAVWAIAAYRPASTNPDVTRAMSDLGWISSMLIWPPLCLGMVLVGIIILKRQGLPGSFPKWLGWFSLFVGVCEFGQAGIIFTKTGVLAPNGLGSWYLAVFTWGPWIILMSIEQFRILGRLKPGLIPTADAQLVPEPR